MVPGRAAGQGVPPRVSGRTRTLGVMTESHERARLEINWAQSTGGALAAVSSAVLLSTFGVAGTLIGAALGSLVITVGGAIYSYSIRATRQRVAAAQSLAAARLARAQARVRKTSDGGPTTAGGAGASLEDAEADLDQARAALDEAPEATAERPDWRTVLRGLPWRRILPAAAGIFVAAMLVILAFELLTGRAVSSYTGGSDPDRRTSIPGIGGGSQTAPAEPGEQPSAPAESDGVAPSEAVPDGTDPTGDPAEPAPSDPVDPSEAVPSEAVPSDPAATDPAPADPAPADPPTEAPAAP